MKNKNVAALLALFLGGLGIHRFYVGSIGTGIFYLLFCWTFVPLILGLIDFFVFLWISEKEFNRRFNKKVFVYGITLEDRILKLHDLLNQGAITEQEFLKRKKELLQ